MAKLNIFLMLILLSLNYTLTTSYSNATNFIVSECRATLYPSLCIQCLTSYSTTIKPSQKQLAQAAVSISLSRAQSVSSFLSKMARLRGTNPTEYRATKDCIEIMANAVEKLTVSEKDLRGLSQEFDPYVVSSIETWIGAALTFENTCLEGFGSRMRDGNVKASVRRRVVDCAHVTSNALALVHRYSVKHTNLP